MPIIVNAATATGSTLNLTAVWLNAAADPPDVAAFEYAGESLNVSTSARVEVRQLAGRTRLIRRGAATAESFGVTFEQCNLEQVAWLRAHVGTLLCVRDHVGTKFFGVYAEVPREVDTRYPNHRDGGVVKAARVNVSISLQQVSYSEAV